MWESLLSEFEVVDDITYPPQACRLLAQYETELGKPLPHSYKKFCAVFGPGELVVPVRYRIAAPGPKLLEDDSWTESRALNAIAKDAHFESEHYITNDLDLSRFANALHFATDIGSYFYFWNTAEVTLPTANEYAIYVIKRSYDIHRLCDTFAEFITEICMKKGIPGDSPSVEREKVFRPENFTGNPFPAVSVTPSWLTSTVLTLARQMHDSRDFGAMPILADALQDAGCDNYEILDHCRHPSHHVRGCWVVDLLLGKK